MSGGGLLFANGGGRQQEIEQQRAMLKLRRQKDKEAKKVKQTPLDKAQKVISNVQKLSEKKPLGTKNKLASTTPDPKSASVSTVPTQAAPPPKSISTASATGSQSAPASTALAQVTPPPPSNPIAATTVSQSAAVSAEPTQVSTSTTPASATLAPLTATATPSSTALSVYNDILTTLIGSPPKTKDSYTPEEQDAILKTLAPLLMSDAEKKFEIKMNKFTTQE
jgi:hypothetical protein